MVRSILKEANMILYINHKSSILRYHVRVCLVSILPRRSQWHPKSVHCNSSCSLRPYLRHIRWENCAIDKELITHGTRTRLFCRHGMTDSLTSSLEYSKTYLPRSQLSFGVSPAIIAVAIGIHTPVDRLLLSFFVLCGLTRLARFNVTVSSIPKDESGNCKYFEGVPIAFSLATIGMMAYWVLMGWTDTHLPMGTWAEDTRLEVHPVVGVFVLHGCSMLSKNIHVPKP